MDDKVPSPGRQVANVLLDAVSAYEPGQGSEVIDLAVARLGEIDGAVQVTFRDEEAGEGEHVSLDVTNLAGGAILALTRLVELLSVAEGVSREEVISDLRAWFTTLD